MSKPKNETAVVVEQTTEAKVTWTKEQADQFIKDKGGVSKAIRSLLAEGKERGEVARLLHKRYQHVRNVALTPIKKGA